MLKVLMFLKKFYCRHDFEYFYLFKLKKCHKCEVIKKFLIIDQLNWYETELSKYRCLSRDLMSSDERAMVDNKMTQLKEWINNIRTNFIENNK